MQKKKKGPEEITFHIILVITCCELWFVINKDCLLRLQSMEGKHWKKSLDLKLNYNI